MSLPPPAPDQAYCDVSALDTGHIKMLLGQLVDTAKSDEFTELPVLSFLLRHSNGAALVFDLGIRPDPQNLPSYLHSFMARMGMQVEGRDIGVALSQGGLDPASIKHIIISHVHFDHTGAPSVFPNAAFHLGGDSASLVAALKTNTEETFSAIEVPPERTRYLPTPEESPGAWAPLGPFPRAHDLLGDGSVYVVDSPGHVAGHITLLARTSPDGAWVFLAGDSAHDWRLITGEAQMGHHPVFGCMHLDEAASRANIERIRALSEMPRVRVLLAHDTPWFAKEKESGMKSFWPGKIASL